ncbi:MAG TPA: metallophosphoesterase [Gammaproteobacteria bacterium]|nr:metallophosphoesterase [Gammaproteobacteria bacterium]
MTRVPTENPLLRLLEKRLSRAHLHQRLGIEREHEQQVFGQGRSLFHIENWYSIHAVIRGVLKLTLMHDRGRRNALELSVTRNEFRIPDLPRAFDGLTIAQISDLHLDMNADIPRVLKETLMQVDYDLCVITGDFRAKTFGPYDKALEAMRGVRGCIEGDVFGILGNHDSIEMVPALEGMGIRMLMNESVALERDGQRIHIAGIDDPHYYKADNIHQAAGDIPVDEVSLLLAHSPEAYKIAAHVGFDAFLCGHTHGGQICLPGGVALMKNAKCPRRYCNGAWSYHGMQGYTSRGSGVSVVDVRFNCPPELTLHTLRRA